MSNWPAIDEAAKRYGPIVAKLKNHSHTISCQHLADMAYSIARSKRHHLESWQHWTAVGAAYSTLVRYYLGVQIDE